MRNTRSDNGKDEVGARRYTSDSVRPNRSDFDPCTRHSGCISLKTNRGAIDMLGSFVSLSVHLSVCFVVYLSVLCVWLFVYLFVVFFRIRGDIVPIF